MEDLFNYLSSYHAGEDRDLYSHYFVNYARQAIIDIYRSINFNQSETNFSELSKHEQNSWYINLQKIYKTEEIDFNSIENFRDELTNSEEILFLLGSYEILIKKKFKTNTEKEAEKKLCNLLGEIFEKNLNKKTQIANQNNPRENIISAIIKKIQPHSFLENFRSNHIFIEPSSSNCLFKKNQEEIIKNLSQKIKDPRQRFYPTKPLEELDIRASAFRFFRYMITSNGNEGRNIASIKYVKNAGAYREVIYLIAYSMGKKEDHEKITLSKNLIANQHRQKIKRNHSEAVLLAAQAIGYIYVEGKGILDLAGFNREYCASIHKPCSGIEDCNTDLLPSLFPLLYANKYRGSRDKNGFRDKLWVHNQKKIDDDLYESDSESETDYDALVIDNSLNNFFDGMDLTNEQQKLERGPVPAYPFNKLFPYYEKKVKKPLKENFFAGYTNFGKGGVLRMQEGGRTVKIGIKKSEMNKNEELENITADIAILKIS